MLGLLCAALALVSLALIKTYGHVPAKELKRLARAGDEAAVLVYKPVAYGLSLQVMLWLLAGLTLAASMVLLADALPAWLAFLLAAVLIWIGFLWIPAGRLSKWGIWLARRVAPPIAWLLERVHPVTSRLSEFISKHRPVTIHTGLYQKSDVAELLTKQKEQPDNRILPGEIDLLLHALSFGDKLVLDVLVPKRAVVSVSAAETIGPKLMDELHKSGHSRFPVYEAKRDNIVGILYLRDLIATKKTGNVSDIMKRRVTYVHEDFTLYQTLQAFIKTKQHLFLVVNGFEEFSGIITIEDVIEQMVGKVIVDEFDNYDDVRAVALKAAHQDHHKHEKADSEPSEVVE